ncbi:sodium:solute symporter family protein [Imperialibacter roseus]|uniref:Sodium:solute symporter family protein n=1 Tax=Imperialibacter roseus TaxID=1324217 RepID=A0ABZ0IPL4_9BACT|nr:sodium:solute symporter family protein [Imperialibacter roseus]WOK06661.1 sodium:solute symporter family protein [Imperialibacter roseus]
MVLSTLDWVIIAVFFAIVVGIGWAASLTAGKSTSEYFLGGRGMPWWLLGISMVACTFSADTPNLVTGMVRENGVAKNWAWWAFLITGMVTVFIYARLWRRSNVMTDLEFYELRYSGKYASFLRGFRSLYLGIFFNCLIMGTVTLAAIKIGQIMLGIENPVYIVVGASIGVVIYATIGGIKGVIWADFFQYSIAMLGAVIAAVVAVSDERVGGLTKLLAHPNVMPKLDIFPSFDDPKQFLPLLIIPIAVQWWSVWYPGAEPGGGGYIAQRMLSAKDEKNAIGATLLFNFAHYALRPWPWILVALASLVIFPDLASIKAEFPGISDNYLGHDIAYPAMLTLLGTGWKGLVVASIIAAYMSTIGTHLNWGSSYVVNDFYKRFVKPDASEKQQVSVGRFTTVGLMFFAAIFSLTILKNATQAFDILLLSGAGTGAIYILRWFWWRINALTEIVAMVVATVLAFLLVLVISPEALENAYLDVFSTRLLISLFGVSAAWISTTLLTKPEDKETLRSFYLRTQPGGPGWKKVVDDAMSEGIVLDASKGANWQMPLQIMMVFVGCVSIYCSLFGIGSFIYGNIGLGFGLLGIAAAGTFILFRNLGKLSLK